APAPTAAPSAGTEADAGAEPAGPPPIVEIGTPSFENGQVPKAEKALAKLSEGIARCVAEHGGLTARAGSMKIQFLVRARGRAEGVEVLSAKNVSREARDCVRLLVKNRSVGAPTADPVGVTVTLSLRASK
ncbi:MAG TPA: hypothetical protein VHB21_16650, partial [Minicystis sp.]|nr:hypothetical protein [Minicystis sp.]